MQCEYYSHCICAGSILFFRCDKRVIMGFGSGCACIRLISGNMSAIRRCEVAAHMWRICTFRAACSFFADDRSIYVKVCSSAILQTINIFRHSLQDHMRVAAVAGNVVNIMHICVAWLFTADDRSVYVKVCTGVILRAAIIFRCKWRTRNHSTHNY